jgi:hypothetical protein
MSYVYSERDHEKVLKQFNIQPVTFPEFVAGFENTPYTTVIDKNSNAGYSVLVKMPDGLMIDYSRTNRFTFLFDLYTQITTLGVRQKFIFTVQSSEQIFRSLMEDMYVNKFLRKVLELVKQNTDHYKYVMLKNSHVFIDFAKVELIRLSKDKELRGVRPFKSLSI